MALKLVGLKLEQFKRITLAELTFDPKEGGVVALMGANEAGKSSALDGFEALVAGRKAPTQKMPIHKGAESARIIGTFQEPDGTEIVVTRRYFPDKPTTIEVRQDGLKAAQPAAILSRLYSHVALDPLAFANLDSKAQVETLLGLIGFDPSKLDQEAANVYATRTEVGQDVKRLTEQLKAFPDEDEALAQKPLVDVREVQQNLEAARAHNAERAEWFLQVERLGKKVVSLDQEIEELEAKLKQLRESRAGLVVAEATAQMEADSTAELPLDGWLEEIASADATNEAIRQQRRRLDVADQLDGAKIVQEGHTARLKAIAEEKAARFAEAKMPIPGLTVEDGEVYLNGTPFSQTSAGGKLRTSTAIAMALNPDLRCIIIRDGSLLDAKNRKIIDELAKGNDFTVLMEVVDETSPSGVIFEDGQIREVREEANV